MNIFQSSSNLLPQDDYLSEIHKCVRDEMVKASSEQHTRHRELDVLFRVVKSIIRSAITSCCFFFFLFFHVSSTFLLLYLYVPTYKSYLSPTTTQAVSYMYPNAGLGTPLALGNFIIFRRRCC